MRIHLHRHFERYFFDILANPHCSQFAGPTCTMLGQGCHGTAQLRSQSEAAWCGGALRVRNEVTGGESVS